MSGSFARDKGQRAEREVIKLLQPVVNEVYTNAGYPESKIPQLERNLMQSNKGGYDIEGLDWIALEVKHQENLQVPAWWKQCVEQSRNIKEAVLFYKQNRVKWRIRMIGFLLVGERRVKCPVEISLEVFLIYFAERLKEEMK